MTRVAVSILNFNDAESTIACVNSLLKAAECSSRAAEMVVVVADNASAASDSQQLRRALVDLPDVELVFNSENLGFAAGHNRNLENVFSHFNPDFVWLLNNDCLVEKETLSALVLCAQRNPDVGIWGATLLEADGQTIQCAGGCSYNSWLSSYRQYGRGKQLSQIDRLADADYDYIAGASLFLPAATLLDGLSPVMPFRSVEGDSAIPYMNEHFFLYFEELDLARRLQPGFGLGWCKEALVKHRGGVGTGAIGRKRSAQGEYHSTLSALKFTRIYYPARLWIIAPARFVLKGLQLMMTANFKLLKPLCRAYLDFFNWLKSNFN